MKIEKVYPLIKTLIIILLVADIGFALKLFDKYYKTKYQTKKTLRERDLKIH
jgi:hypothetical protein